MKKLLTVLSATALLGLAACGDDNVEAGDTTIVEGDSAPAMSAPVEASAPAEENGGDSFSISRDGVTADINDGDTSISVDADGDPSLTVEKN